MYTPAASTPASPKSCPTPCSSRSTRSRPSGAATRRSARSRSISLSRRCTRSTLEVGGAARGCLPDFRKDGSRRGEYSLGNVLYGLASYSVCSSGVAYCTYFYVVMVCNRASSKSARIASTQYSRLGCVHPQNSSRALIVLWAPVSSLLQRCYRNCTLILQYTGRRYPRSAVRRTLQCVEGVLTTLIYD